MLSVMKSVPAELKLDLPWIESVTLKEPSLRIVRGAPNSISFPDGITLGVSVVIADHFRSVDDLHEAVVGAERPGTLVLVVGFIPQNWRSTLRSRETSFIDAAGIAELYWPRLRVTARRFGQIVERNRKPLGFQKNFAVVAQTLILGHLAGERLSVSQLADRAAVSPATASRAVSQLQEHGLVQKQRDGNSIYVIMTDLAAIRRQLAEGTAWPSNATLFGYFWGRTIFETAQQLSQLAAQLELNFAITGSIAAAAYGVGMSSTHRELHVWVRDTHHDLQEVAEMLHIDPARKESANVVLSTDPWKFGTQNRTRKQWMDFSLCVANPVRVWCDLHAEPRGDDVAHQLWSVIEHEAS